MAHRGSGGGGGQGGGIESLAPRVGQFTALVGVIAIVGAAWIAIRYPATLLSALVAAMFLSCVLGTSADPSNHPIVALLMCVIGVCIAPKRKTDRKDQAKS